MQEEQVSAIQTYRREIDDLDGQLIECLARRFEVAKRIAQFKKAHGLPVVQPDRAAEVAKRYVIRGREHYFAEDFMVQLYELIHQETCRVERDMMNDDEQATGA